MGGPTVGAAAVGGTPVGAATVGGRVVGAATVGGTTVGGTSAVGPAVGTTGVDPGPGKTGTALGTTLAEEALGDAEGPADSGPADAPCPGVTVTGTLADSAPSRATIFVTPGPTPVTTPRFVTVATAGFSLVNEAPPNATEGAGVPSACFPASCRCAWEPAGSETSAGAMRIVRSL